MASQSLSILSTSFPSSKPAKTAASLLNALPVTQLSLRRLTTSWPSIQHKKKHSPAVSLSLPTAEPVVPVEKSPNWSARAIKAFAMGELEARKLKYPTTGTEALLMGILVEGTSLAAKFLRANGVTLFNVRDEIVKLLGRSDMYFFSPEHPPLTEPAQRALDYAIQEKLKSGVEGEITTTYLLLGIWSEKESAGHKIMESFGFNDEKAAELAKSKDQDYILSYR